MFQLNQVKRSMYTLFTMSVIYKERAQQYRHPEKLTRQVPGTSQQTVLLALLVGLPSPQPSQAGDGLWSCIYIDGSQTQHLLNFLQTVYCMHWHADMLCFHILPKSRYLSPLYLLQMMICRLRYIVQSSGFITVSR